MEKKVDAVNSYNKFNMDGNYEKYDRYGYDAMGDGRREEDIHRTNWNMRWNISEKEEEDDDDDHDHGEERKKEKSKTKTDRQKERKRTSRQASKRTTIIAQRIA